MKKSELRKIIREEIVNELFGLGKKKKEKETNPEKAKLVNVLQSLANIEYDKILHDKATSKDSEILKLVKTLKEIENKLIGMNAQKLIDAITKEKKEKTGKWSNAPENLMKYLKEAIELLQKEDIQGFRGGNRETIRNRISIVKSGAKGIIEK